MSDRYIGRVVDADLDELLPELPALALEGLKGVGKTETATRRARTVRRLDDPRQLEVAAAEPGLALRGEAPVLLDEWQRLPEVWDHVRRAVDAGAPPGSYLLTGSAVPTQMPAHSGAGRIATLRMRPLSLAERRLDTATVSLAELLVGNRPQITGETQTGLQRYGTEILASGFPGLRGLGVRALETQLDAFLDHLSDRDFLELGHRVRSPQALRRWMTAYAAATSTCASFETIRRAATGGESLKPAKTTTQPYRDTLERLFLVDPIPAWLPSRNRIARLSSPPKHHLADPALAARLLGMDLDALLDGEDATPAIARDGVLLGAMFESLVALSVRVYAQRARARVGHMRTRGGEREVDLIVERGDGRVIALEVKLSSTVSDHDVRHIRWLASKLGDDLLDALVITTGPAAYRRADGIGVVPAALLGA